MRSKGIFIPVSRVNTAYNYYKKLLDHDAVMSGKRGLPGNREDFMLNRLDADDDWTVNILWTDIKAMGRQNDIERAGLSKLFKQGGSGPDSYIYVKPGQKPGNVLIEIKSGKIKGNPTLWSWHIWIVDKYPTVLNIGKYGGDGAETVQLMSHLLGPTRRLIHSIVKVRIRNSACNTNGAGKTRSRHMTCGQIRTFMTAMASHLISFGSRKG